MAVAAAVAAVAAALPELAVQVVLILLQQKYYLYNDVMCNMIYIYVTYISIDIHSQSSTRYMCASFDMRFTNISICHRCEFNHAPKTCPT